MATIDSKIPEGALAEKWTNYKAHQKLVNPANKRRLDIIVVGTGLAGASAAASLGALGFKVLNFCIQDSPRRAHSIAAQGGINAAKNYLTLQYIRTKEKWKENKRQNGRSLSTAEPPSISTLDVRIAQSWIIQLPDTCEP